MSMSDNCDNVEHGFVVFGLCIVRGQNSRYSIVQLV